MIQGDDVANKISEKMDMVRRHFFGTIKAQIGDKVVTNRVIEWLYSVTADLRNYSAWFAEKTVTILLNCIRFLTNIILKKYLRETVEPVTAGLRNSS